MNTTITADDLEIDITEMGVADAAIANGVIAQQAKRIAELDSEAREYLAANKKAERIIAKLEAEMETLRQAYPVAVLAPDTPLRKHVAELQAQLAQRINTPCPSCGNQTLFVSTGGHLTCSLLGCKQPSVATAIADLRAERDAAIADARALAKLVNFHTRYEVSVKEWALIQKYLTEETK